MSDNYRNLRDASNDSMRLSGTVPILFYSILFYPIQSNLILSYPILSYPIQCSPLLSSPILSFPLLSNLMLSSPLLSSPLLSYPLLSSPLLSSPILSYPIKCSPLLSYLIQSNVLLSSPLLSYHCLTSIKRFHILFLVTLQFCIYKYLCNISCRCLKSSNRSLHFLADRTGFFIS